MNELSRRDFLQALAAAYGAAVMGCRRKGDRFAQELVCIHILHPAEFVPAPLMEKTTPTSARGAAGDYFSVGLPELIICTTRTRLLDLFQYFWPFSRDDFAHLQESIDIRYYKPVIRGAADIEDFAKYVRDHKSELSEKVESAVIFTFNDFTRHWTPDLIAACRQVGVQEFVVFKDPSRPPYLCDYPAKQKGFKRPPP